jgi:hypothetical protein
MVMWRAPVFHPEKWAESLHDAGGWQRLRKPWS